MCVNLLVRFQDLGVVNVTANGNGVRNKSSLIYVGSSKDSPLGTRGFFSRVRPDSSVSAVTET